MFQLEEKYTGLIVVVVLYILYRIVKWRRYVYILFKLPGPKGIPFFDNIFQIIFLDSVPFFKLLISWNEKYGPLYVASGLGRPVVNICGPDEFEAIASTMKHSEKGPLYGLLDLWLGQGLLTSKGAQWQQRRKILTPAFHFSILQQFIQIFNSETDNLVARLQKETRKPFTNLIPFMSQTTLYTIAETSFGTKMDEKNTDDKNYISSSHQLGKIITYRSLRFWFHNTKIFNTFSSLSTKHNNLIEILHKFTNRIIEKKSKQFKAFEVIEDDFSLKKKLALLDLLLNAKIRDGIIDDKGIQDEVNTFMFEGHDTTSMAISFTLLLLANHKKYQNLIYEEIIGILGDLNKQPDINDLNEMKLMERVIKESLRLYPSVPFISRILETDMTLNGYLIPKKTSISIWIYSIHRNPMYWPDPEKFDPDRFLPENCVGRHPYCYVPFSAGPRNCIGQKYAILELKAILCGILKHFTLEPVDTCDSIKLILDLVLRTQGESIKLRFKPRNPKL